MSLTTGVHGKSIGAFPALFRSLPVVPVESLQGLYSGQLTGPLWLRLFSGPLLGLLGLPRWWGKLVAGPGVGFNLARHGQAIASTVPFTLERRPSLIDGQLGVTLVYAEAARLPLPWLVDELRPLDENTLLGMSMFARLGLHRLPVPFLLHRLGPATMLSAPAGSPR